MGGGGGGSQIASAPIPTPAPPVTATNPAVVQAEHDMAQSNLLKKSVKQTMIAGDTGGYQPGASGAAPSTFKAKLG